MSQRLTYANAPDQPMLCAYCGEKRSWPHDFPATHYAKCAWCMAKKSTQVSGPGPVKP